MSTTPHEPAAAAPTNPASALPVDRRALLGGLLGAAGAAALAGVAKAGPLNPPAGPVSPTGKTLAEVEPRTAVNAANTPGDSSAVFIIAQPGSYYLPADLTVPANMVGIRIAASDVSLDLNGFRLTGAGGAGNAGIADVIFGNQTNIEVRNGLIEAMAGAGIGLGATLCRIADLITRDNGGLGLSVGARSRIERVLAISNSLAGGFVTGGMNIGSDSLVLRCQSNQNAGPGISAADRCVLIGCAAAQNASSGISAGAGSVVLDCNSQTNTGWGVATSAGSVIRSCYAFSCGVRGVEAAAGSVVLDCRTLSCATGVGVADGCVVGRCSAAGSTGAGFVLNTTVSGGGVVAFDCLASTNNVGFDGSLGAGNLVAGCASSTNGNDGFLVGSRSLVLGNWATDDATIGPNAAGIRVTGTLNRIEGNHCVAGHGYGIWVTGQRNMIEKNTSTQNNVNWNFTVNCLYGPVINQSGGGTPAMSGNGTTPSAMGTTDPWANITL